MSWGQGPQCCFISSSVCNTGFYPTYVNFSLHILAGRWGEVGTRNKPRALSLLRMGPYPELPLQLKSPLLRIGVIKPIFMNTRWKLCVICFGEWGRLLEQYFKHFKQANLIFLAFPPSLPFSFLPPLPLPLPSIESLPIAAGLHRSLWERPLSRDRKHLSFQDQSLKSLKFTRSGLKQSLLVRGALGFWPCLLSKSKVWSWCG